MSTTTRVDEARIGAWRAMLYANDRLLKRLAEEMLRDQGLDMSWYEVMLHVAEAEGSITQRELLELTMMGQSGLSRVLAKMEDAQLVRRVAVESDRRNLNVELTELGRERLRRAAPGHVAGIKRWFGDSLTVRQAEAIRTGLERVLARLSGEIPTTEPARVAIGSSMLSVATDAVSVSDTLRVRDALEALIVSDAARYATRDDAADLRQLVASMARRTDSPVEFLRADWRLHRRIAQISPNQVLTHTYTNLIETLEQHVASILPDKTLPDYIQERLRLHASLVDAIIDHDVEEAERLASEHDVSTSSSLSHSTR